METERVPAIRVSRVASLSISASASIFVPSSVVVSSDTSSGPLKRVVSSYLILSIAPLTDACLRKSRLSLRSYSAVTVASLPRTLRAWLHFPLMLSKVFSAEQRSPEISSIEPWCAGLEATAATTPPPPRAARAVPAHERSRTAFIMECLNALGPTSVVPAGSAPDEPSFPGGKKKGRFARSQ
eukprot:scaffold6339_cov112-Isochrysis_galbana.AAC.5